MRTSEDMERRLREQLIPRGMSAEGAAALDDLIDELAAEQPASGRARRAAWVGGLAACLVAAGVAAVFHGPGLISGKDAQSADAGALRDADPGDAVSLVSESRGVVAAEWDERVMSDDEGNLLQAWHVEVVNEERFHDRETGHEVRVVHPRDELVLLPVSSF